MKAKWKQVWIEQVQVIVIRPESKWSSHKQVESMWKHMGGPNS